MIMLLLSLYFKVGNILINHHRYKIPWSYFWSKNYHIYKNPVPLSVRYPWSYMHDTFYLQTFSYKQGDIVAIYWWRRWRNNTFSYKQGDIAIYWWWKGRNNMFLYKQGDIAIYCHLILRLEHVLVRTRWHWYLFLSPLT